VQAFNAIQHHIREHGRPPRWADLKDDPAVDSSVREFMGNLDSEKRVRTVADATAAVRTLNKYRVLRGMWTMQEDILVGLQKSKMNADGLIDQASEALARIKTRKQDSDSALHYGIKGNSKSFVRDLLYSKEKADFIPTGFKDFDKENGGFMTKSLVILAGSTGAGKSALANQLSKNWAGMGEPVVVVPLEMSKLEMSARLLANVADIDSRKILLKRLSDSEKRRVYRRYRNWSAKVKAKGGRYTILKPDEDLTIEQLLPLAHTYGPKIVVIDYISLLKGVDGDDQWLQLGKVARYAKIYADIHDMIVVLLAQVSDDGIVRYSRAIREHASYMWSFVATKESMESEILNIDQQKGRNARRFPFSLSAKLDTMRIGDLEPSQKHHVSEKNQKSNDKSSKKPTNKNQNERKGKASSFMEELEE
jgi:hypothetical protein